MPNCSPRLSANSLGRSLCYENRSQPLVARSTPSRRRAAIAAAALTARLPLLLARAAARDAPALCAGCTSATMRDAPVRLERLRGGRRGFLRRQRAARQLPRGAAPISLRCRPDGCGGRIRPGTRGRARSPTAPPSASRSRPRPPARPAPARRAFASSPWAIRRLAVYQSGRLIRLAHDPFRHRIPSALRRGFPRSTPRFSCSPACKCRFSRSG